MRLPRWLLVSLIAVSAAALLAVPGWLWVEMPRRTAATFVAAIEARDLDRADRQINITGGKLATTLEGDSWYLSLSRDGTTDRLLSIEKLSLGTRSIRDLLDGVQPLKRNKLPSPFYATWGDVRIGKLSEDEGLVFQRRTDWEGRHSAE